MQAVVDDVGVQIQQLDHVECSFTGQDYDDACSHVVLKRHPLKPDRIGNVVRVECCVEAMPSPFSLHKEPTSTGCKAKYFRFSGPIQRRQDWFPLLETLN